MSCRITDSENVALYDSVTGAAFGDVFRSAEHAEDFLVWSEQHYGHGFWDPRALTRSQLEERRAKWQSQRLDLNGELLERSSNAPEPAGVDSRS